MLIATLLIGGFAAMVYLRAYRVAHWATRDTLRVQAQTLASLLEIGTRGIEFEAKSGTMPEFEKEGSGAYAVIRDAAGKVVVRSPSLGGRALPEPPPWRSDLLRFEEVERGPFGRPLATVTMGITAPLDGSEKDWEKAGREPPPEAKRRCRIQVALDTGERDRALGELALFLVLAGAGGLLATAAAGLLLARRVLGPLRRMTREAALLTPEDRGRRLTPETVVKEVAGLASTLNAALDRQAEALDLQRRFTSDAGHELRTPVSILIANAELLLRSPRTPEEYREGIERQLRTSHRMRHITENLLTLARADFSANGIHREPVDLTGLLRSFGEEFHDLAEEAGLEIACDLEERVAVTGDRRYLGQLAENLLSNAVKFTPRGGRVTVRLRTEPGAVELQVADTGPGIPAEHLDRIFERFFRVNDGSDRAEGAGLGLAIVKWVAESHGGTVEVVSRVGEGTTVRVRLPRPAE